MSFALDIASDFADVVDGLSAVGLKNRAGVQSSLSNVLRRAIRTREAAASNGRYLASDVTFHVPITEQSRQVRPGWQIVDADGAWTVLEIGGETLSNRHRFVCRNMALVYDLEQRVNLQAASWAKNADGVLEATWTTTQADIPCRWNYVSGDNDTEHELRHQPRQVVLFLETAQLLSESNRFIINDPSLTLNIVSWTDAESIGKLMQVNCEVVPWLLS